MLALVSGADVSETALSAAIREACNLQRGVRLRRNNVGKLRDEHGRVITYGQGVGSPDLMGELTGEWCCSGPCSQPTRHRIARAFHLEVKVGRAKPTADQLAWHKEARSRGVFVAVVHSVDEALAAVKRCRRGEVE
jgi:hypothetical protein